MLIDVTDETTFPAALKETVYDFLATIDDNTSNELREHVLESNSDVDCVEGEYITKSRAPSLYKNVTSILEQCSLICYHATRVIRVQDIKNLGLRVNDWDWYSASLIKALKALDISESDIDSLVTIVQKEYTYKYTDCNRKPQICLR